MKTLHAFIPKSILCGLGFFLLFSFHSFSQAWDIIYQAAPEMGRDIILTNDYCYLATSINSPFDIGKSIKINQRGAIVWEIPYGGMAVQQTSDNGYVLAGCNSYQDAMLTKLDETGNPLWNKLYGGWQQDEFFAVIESSDQGLVAGGVSYSHGDSTIYIVKTDEEGNMQWYRNFKAYENGLVADLLEFDGNLYVVCPTYDANYTRHLYVTKLNSAGTQLWSKMYQGWFLNPSVEMTPDTTLIICGGNILLKLDLDGDSLWSKSLDPRLDLASIDIAPDHGFILSGSKVFANMYFTNALVKTDSLGNVEWTKIYRGVYNDYWGKFESVKSANENGYTACGYSLFENSETKWRIIKTDAYGDCIVDLDPGQKIETSIFYPNPTTGKIFSNSKNFQRMEVLTASGSSVMSCTDCNQIDISTQPSGVYILKIHQKNNTAFEKIIKQ